MRYLKNQIVDEIIIKKSKFITILTPLKNDGEILDVLNQIKKDYPKATHYCTAYVLGKNGEYAGSNDDGEPAGTAGIPMLESLKQANVTNILAVVVRYYGGIHLGAGGLTRAYSNCVTNALKLGDFYTLIKALKYEIKFGYDKVNEIDYLLKDEKIITKEFKEMVTYVIGIVDLDNFNKIKYHFEKIKKLEEILLAKDLK